MHMSARLLIIAVGCLSFGVAAQELDDCGEPGNEAYRLALQDRSARITPPRTAEFTLPERNTIADNDGVHALVQLCRHPTPDDLGVLRQFGLTLDSRLQGTAWFTRLPENLARSLVGNDSPEEAFARLPQDIAIRVRWIGAITPALKQAPTLAEGRFADYAFDRAGRLRLLVAFYRDIEDQQAEDLLRSFGANYARHANKVWRVVLDPASLPDLVAEDAVRFVQQGPTPLQPQNDYARHATNVDTLQAVVPGSNPPAYMGLTGDGVVVAIMDTPVDTKHQDFWEHDASGNAVASRIPNGSTGADFHGTHVAGTIGGNGYQSAQQDDLGNDNSGMAYQWRGMAPRATLLSYVPALGVGAAELYYEAINVMGADISNHSYKHDCTFYGVDAETTDRVIRGDEETTNGVFVPARPHVNSAGNEGFFLDQYCPASGYYSVTVSAKNPIAVGALNNSDGRLHPESSLGPTPDGRLKPDVVAPGCELTSSATEDYTGDFDDAHPNGYDEDCGTSMAAAAVTGTLTLLLEEWKQAFGGCAFCGPLNSTMKAVLVQSARDLIGVEDFPNPDTAWRPVSYARGPDYATGYGSIDAVSARELITPGPGSGRRLIESEIATTAEIDIYRVVVTGTSQELKVTLAWDDPPASSGDTQIASKLFNDLDLALTGPDGVVRRPWVIPVPTPAQKPNPYGVLDFDPDGTESIDPAMIAASPADPANKQPDRRNNVEQVQIDNALPGPWEIHVTAFAMPGIDGPQKYSLTASHPLQYWLAFSPPDVGESACLEPKWIPHDAGFELLEIPSPCVAISMEPICHYVVGCPGCEFSGYCAPMDLVFRRIPETVHLGLYDHREGTVLTTDVKKGNRRLLHWEPEQGVRYSLLLYSSGKQIPAGNYGISGNL